MAVTSFGTPSIAHATSGTVTSSWGGGQNRTAHNVLVAAVAAGAATSVSGLTATSGWTQAAYSANAGTAHSLAAFYWKVAAGSDAAPAFGATLSGTGAMTATLFELAAGNVLVPIDTSGTYASGSVSGSLSSMTVTTSSNANLAGEYAITCFAQEAASGTNSWNPGAGWSNATNDGTYSSVLHTAVDYKVPTAGTLASETGHWSTNASAYGAAAIVSAMAWTPGLELYANTPSGTISSGATDAPAAGTAELVTSAWTGFPTANPALSPPTYFTIADQSATTELVTTVNTSSGAVIRGTEGSTPVTHSAGWLAWQAEGPGGLGSFPQVHNVRSVLYGGGAKGDGVTDDTLAIQAAVTAAINAGGGIVYLPEGTYKTTFTITANVTGVAVYIQGAGRWATTIAYYGSGDCLRIYDTTSVRTGANGGGVAGLTIDGTNSSASAASAGLHMGDMFQYYVDFTVQNFANFTGSIGAHFDNQYSWTEQMQGTIYAINCISHVVFDHASGAGASSTGSFDRLQITIFIDQANATYDGVVFQNGANTQDATLGIYGNFVPQSAAVTSAVLRITGSSPAGTGDTGTYSALNYSRIYVGVECDGTAANGPYCIYFGSTSNAISSCSGQMDFYAATTAFQAAQNVSGNFDFAGDLHGASG
ncbi:MAG TPA: glycosyl hydrolase family 28-related protein, partial [Mycobacterium sp.]|nr:glycosyl hydrolase family 28-related protein [Mycobacterium sp.]